MRESLRSRIDDLPCFPYLIRRFASEQDVLQAMAFLSGAEAAFGKLDPGGAYWQGRTVSLEQVQDPAARDVLRRLRAAIAQALGDLLARHITGLPRLYSELITYARWPVGYELEPHADSENPGGDAHPFPWRDFACVIYLNTDYEGGTIYFPNQGIELKPAPGTAVLFPGTLRYLHGVRPITRGMRYTISAFLTFDPTRSRE